MNDQMQVKALISKSREWRAEAERSTPQWRPMYEMLAAGYARIAGEWAQDTAAHQLRG